MAGDEGRMASDMVPVVGGLGRRFDKVCGDLGMQASMILWMRLCVQKTCRRDERLLRIPRAGRRCSGLVGMAD